jgi:allantoin racemase
VVPVLSRQYSRPKEIFSAALGPEHELSVVFISKGPASIENEFDEALAAPEVIARVCMAERDGYEAVVIDCFGDPGVKASREVVNIPVVGAGEAAMYVAASLGHKFSIIAVDRDLLPMFYNNCTICGLTAKLASIRFVDIPVLALQQEQANVLDRLSQESIKAIEEDGAHCITLGCTGMTGMAQALQTRLRQADYPVPVIDPMIAALKRARALVEMGLSYSKVTYAYPPKKEIVGYNILCPGEVS